MILDNEKASSSTILVHLEGPPEAVTDVSEQIIWMAATMDAHSYPGTVKHIPRLVRDPITQSNRVQIIHEKVPSEGHSLPQEFVGAECWQSLLPSIAVVEGFPVPLRNGPSEQGLEIQFSTMCYLSRVIWATSFDEYHMLKGWSTALVLTALSTTSATWHFVESPYQTRLSYSVMVDSLPGDLEMQPFTLDQADSLRHFVGWTPHAKLVAGECHQLPTDFPARDFEHFQSDMVQANWIC